MFLGADDTVERRSGWQITAKGGDRDAVRSTRKLIIHGWGLKGVVMMLLGPGAVVPGACRCYRFSPRGAGPPRKPRSNDTHTGIDGVRQMRRQARRWLPGLPRGVGR